MNFVKEYGEKVINGDIVASKEIKAIYTRLLKEMNDETFPFYFDEDVGKHPIDFIETYCKYFQGDKAGQYVKLELFQKAFIQNLFGWLEKDTNRRRFREYFFEVARKHGKSFLSGCIAIYMLVADGEDGAEVYSCATKLDQAKIIFNVAKNIVEQSSELRALIKSTREGLSFKMTRSIMKALPNESKSLDGLNIHFACLDEVHEMRDRNLYDVLKQGTTARRQPLIGCITTSGFYRNGLYDNLHERACDVANGKIKDDRLLPLIYKLDEEDEWLEPSKWIKSNPALGTIKSYVQLAENVERAKTDSAFLPTLLTKDFNIKQNQSNAWLPLSSIVNENIASMDYLKKSYAIGGCDLSSVYDLTCCSLLIRKPNDENVYVLQHYFIPKSKIEMLEKTKSKEAPYELWEKQGWLTINDGTQVDYHLCTEWFAQMVQEYDIRPLWICYDRALSGYWIPEMVSYGFEMEKTAQGMYTFSQPMKEMGATLEAHKVVYQNNPILRWCLANTGVKVANPDGLEMIMPVKVQQQRRIDGMVSLLNAWVGYMKHYDDYMSYVR